MRGLGRCLPDGAGDKPWKTLSGQNLSAPLQSSLSGELGPGAPPNCRGAFRVALARFLVGCDDAQIGQMRRCLLCKHRRSFLVAAQRINGPATRPPPHFPMQKWRFRRMLLIFNVVMAVWQRAWTYSWTQNQACPLVAANGPSWTLPALSSPVQYASKRSDQGRRTWPSTLSNVQCAAACSFSHLLIRNTKDVAPCFSSKKREARSSD